MGELVESRQMFKAERSQSHREGSLGNGRREGERPHEDWGGGCSGRRLPETLLHPLSVCEAGGPEEHGVMEDTEEADRMSQGRGDVQSPVCGSPLFF